MALLDVIHIMAQDLRVLYDVIGRASHLLHDILELGCDRVLEGKRKYFRMLSQQSARLGEAILV